MNGAHGAFGDGGAQQFLAGCQGHFREKAELLMMANTQVIFIMSEFNILSYISSAFSFGVMVFMGLGFGWSVYRLTLVEVW